jgi:hypothetical protein
MERELRAWWNGLSKAEQDAWISAWETDVVSDDASITMPAEWIDRWTTGGSEARRPAPKLADFLEQQAAARFLNAGQPQRRL